MSLFHKFQLTSKVLDKCRASKCRHSNSPQAADITDDCVAVSGSYNCEDSYPVSHTADDKVIRLHKESGRQETESECLAQLKVRSEEVKCAKLLRYQREQGKQQAATEFIAAYELKPLKFSAHGRHGIGQRRPCGADGATQHSTSYLIQPTAAVTKHRKDLHRVCPIPAPSMSYPLAYLMHPTFRT